MALQFSLYRDDGVQSAEFRTGDSFKFSTVRDEITPSFHSLL
jgi:hypothetical protein